MCNEYLVAAPGTELLQLTAHTFAQGDELFCINFTQNFVLCACLNKLKIVLTRLRTRVKQHTEETLKGWFTYIFKQERLICF